MRLVGKGVEISCGQKLSGLRVKRTRVHRRTCGVIVLGKREEVVGRKGDRWCKGLDWSGLFERDGGKERIRARDPESSRTPVKAWATSRADVRCEDAGTMRDDNEWFFLMGARCWRPARVNRTKI